MKRVALKAILFKNRISRPPRRRFDHLYYDPCSWSLKSIEFSIKLAEVDRAIFGTDFRFDIRDAEGKRALAAIQPLPAQARSKVFRDDAASVLDAIY